MSRHYIENFDPKEFVAEIRQFMKKKSISYEKFAEITKSSRETLYRIDKGTHGITIATAQKFINFMKTYDAS